MWVSGSSQYTYIAAIQLRDASASRSQAGVMESDDENEREGGFGRALAARLPAAGEAHALGARGGCADAVRGLQIGRGQGCRGREGHLSLNRTLKPD